MSDYAPLLQKLTELREAAKAELPRCTCGGEGLGHYDSCPREQVLLTRSDACRTLAVDEMAACAEALVELSESGDFETCWKYNVAEIDCDPDKPECGPCKGALARTALAKALGCEVPA